MWTEAKLTENYDIERLDQNVLNCCRLSATHPKLLYLLMQRYTHFNGYAGPLVIRLASSFGISRELFKRKYVKSVDDADQGIEVAAHIFSAAIDEFSDQHISNMTHRKAAQATLYSIGQYAGLNEEQRNEFSIIPGWLTEIVHETLTGYQGEIGNAEALIRALGFHCASEFLADREYGLIDRIIFHEEKSNGYHQFLQKPANRSVTFYGDNLHPWYWVKVHGSHNQSGVEKDHFEEALKGIDLITRSEGVDEKQTEKLIFQGFDHFCKLQYRLFSDINQELLNLNTELQNQAA